MELKTGDHIYVWRTRSKRGYPLPLPYQHHGIYAGRGRVIHLCGEPGLGQVNAEVRYDDLSTFTRGSSIRTVAHADRAYGRDAVRRARKRLGEKHYSLRSYNCEHFATECCTGEARSHQVRAAATVALLLCVTPLLTGITGGVLRGRRAASPV